MFAPDYRTARSVQMNMGFQHEFGKGVVWTTDIVRNVGTRNLLAVDVNHVGDAQFLETDAAWLRSARRWRRKLRIVHREYPMRAGAVPRGDQLLYG